MSEEIRNMIRRLSVDSTATPFGCCNYFDACADAIFALSMQGRLGLLDWFGFHPTQDCYRSVEFINYIRPEQSGGSCTPGYIDNPCSDPYGIEIGACKLTVEDFGLVGRAGPTRSVNQPKNYCKTRPRYRLDGSVVDNEIEWDMLFTMETLLGDVRRLIVTGNSAVPGQFDGLQQWVATGYDCEMLDAIVIDWAQNGMGGGAGITWNGVPQTIGFNFVDALLAVHRHIMDRISWAPAFAGSIGRPQDVDMVIIGPSFLIRCLLDEYACWSVCPGAQYEEVVKAAKEIREFRQTLNGGRFGAGRIALDGHDIDCAYYDWGLINSQNTGDMYLLTGQINGVRIWEGEFLDANEILSQFGSTLGVSPDNLFSVDGGRVLGGTEWENLCYRIKLWQMLRLFCLAPWMQARFMDVACAHFGPTISPDACDTCFYPETCFTPAECP